MYYLYILISLKTGRYYVGSTQSIKDRLSTHNLGRVKSTKPYKPWKLIYKESYNTLSGARKREYQIKSWKKRSAIERLLNR